MLDTTAKYSFRKTTTIHDRSRSFGTCRSSWRMAWCFPGLENDLLLPSILPK